MTGSPVACWRAIGVWGDGSCPQLPSVVHCANCPVFAEAARGVFDRPIDTAYLAWSTEAVATRQPPAARPDRVVLTFEVAREALGIDAATVRAIAPPGVVRRLPHRADPALLGLVAVRGELMPCVALARLLDLSGADAPRAGGGAPTVRDPGLLVVVADEEGPTALLVDRALGVEGIRRAETRSGPDTVSATLRPVTDGLHRIGEVDVTLLDPIALAERVRGAFR